MYSIVSPFEAADITEPVKQHIQIRAIFDFPPSIAYFTDLSAQSAFAADMAIR